MAVDFPQARAASSPKTIGPVDLPTLPSAPERLLKISPELEAYDRAIRESFEMLKKKFNELENAIRNS